MTEILTLIADVGAPIAGALVMGFFIFLVIRQILEGIVDQVKTLTIFCKSLEARASTMSNEMMKIDLLVHYMNAVCRMLNESCRIVNRCS